MNREIKALRPTTRLLTVEFIEKIIDEACEVLEKTGVWVDYEPALTLLKEAGVKVDLSKKRAYIGRNFVEEALKTVPSAVNFYDRNEKLVVELYGDNCYFEPGSAATKVWDEEKKVIRDPITLDTVEHFIVADYLPYIDGLGGGIVPTDVPVEIRDRYRLFLSLKYSSKPITNGGTFTMEGFQVEKELLLVIRGTEKNLKEKPLCALAACPSPPLKWSDLTCHDLMEGAKYGIPIILISMPLTGAAAPITIAGSLVQHTAESLSGVVISQLTKKGAPLIWGGSPAAFDMRFGTTPMGAIETIMIDMAYSEIGKNLNIPTQAYIGMSDSKCLDAQTGLETAMGTLLGALGGINLITGAGMMNFETTQSLEKMVIDNEICGMARRISQGITGRGEVLAEDLFTEGLYDGKHFLLSPTTMKWFKKEYYYPGVIISREDDQAWIKKGSTNAQQRASMEVKRILTSHKPIPLEENTEKNLQQVITRDAKKYGMEKLPVL